MNVALLYTQTYYSLINQNGENYTFLNVLDLHSVWLCTLSVYITNYSQDRAMAGIKRQTIYK